MGTQSNISKSANVITSTAAANDMLDIAMKDGEGLTPMKIQKLVYIAHGWHLGLYNEILVDEDVEAWQWGPVFPRLYHQVKHYGRWPIAEKITDSKGDLEHSIDGNHYAHMQEVWNKYHKYTGMELAMLTHQDGTPWHKEVREYLQHIPREIPRGLKIPYYPIRDYYKSLSNS